MAAQVLIENRSLEQVAQSWSELPRGPESEVATWLLGAWRAEPAPLPESPTSNAILQAVIQRCLFAGRGDLVEQIVDDLTARPKEALGAPIIGALRAVTAAVAGG